ncbi:MAG: N-acetyltransferase, partial [Deltaproteobacteria bacterium]|nr:N-acetyltransferase [Deltaproteobacteria bacterium]
MHIRKAVVGDMKAIHKILNHYADQGLLLPRPLSELYDHLRDYFVLDDETRPGVHGVCGLGICWDDLAEIKGLAVAEDVRGRGFGAGLVEACLKEAGNLELKKVFTLTYIPRFFEKMGFEEVHKSSLPNKIWSDCLKCPKFPDCDETA